MPISPLPLIIFRPEPGASASVARAEAMGFHVVKAPLFEVEAMNWAVPDAGDHDALLLTSANAAREAGAGLAALAGLPCLAIGEATAKAARAVGLNVIWVGAGAGGAALEEAAQRGLTRLLWLSGEQHSPLVHPKITLTVTPVYRAMELPFPDEAVAALQHPAILLVHSQRAAWAIADAIKERTHLGLITISGAVAAVAGEGWAWARWPDVPRDEDMLELVRTLCQKAQP